VKDPGCLLIFKREGECLCRLTPGQLEEKRYGHGSQLKMPVIKSPLSLRELSINQINRIDALLDSVGEHGAVELIIQRGELRYINRLESFKARIPMNRRIG